MRRQNVKATWDEGWVGKHVNGPPSYEPEPATRSMSVSESDDKVLLYAVEDGVTVAYWRTRRAGFVR